MKPLKWATGWRPPGVRLRFWRYFGGGGQVGDWEWSSFQRYVRMGYYEADWGGEVGRELEGMRCGE
jgi:hypothetical protein